MARIMCTQKLWRAMGKSGLPPNDLPEPGTLGAALGSWAAKLFHYDRRALVLALNERTYLTLVFPLSPRAKFRTHFATALEWALADLGVAPSSIEQETAVIDFLPLARLTHRSMTGSLNDLEFLGRCELDYTDDLRRVQLNLNEVPHVNREPCIPIEAVAQVFSGVAVGPSAYKSH
jgi:hypothetical protein